MKEKLQEYALLAEIVSAIAIVISLVFVGLQIQLSNTMVRTDSLRDSTQIWVAAYTQAFGTEESTAFFRKAASNYDDLNNDERGRFFTIMSGFVSSYDNIYNQYESGALREDVFVSIALLYYGIVGMPGARRVLEDNVAMLPPYLVDYSVNEILIGQEESMEHQFSFLKDN
ncbi:MAG: hypothetical protein HQ498_12715 [Pseudohongiella sp.]|nr:hypothetical protein [Pseudohongiella sp.]